MQQKNGSCEAAHEPQPLQAARWLQVGSRHGNGNGKGLGGTTRCAQPGSFRCRLGGRTQLQHRSQEHSHSRLPHEQCFQPLWRKLRSHQGRTSVRLPPLPLTTEGFCGDSFCYMPTIRQGESRP